MHNFDKNTIKSFLRFKKEKVVTKKDYRRAFVKNPRFFLKREGFMDHFMSYISSPSNTETKNKMRFFLFTDNITQFIRGAFKFLFADNPIIFLVLGFFYIKSRDIHIVQSMIASVLLLIAFILNLSVYLFYTVDHMISIIATFKSSLHGSSEYLAKSYLDLTKVKSDNIDFLYFDKAIDFESRAMYEEWVLELLEKLPIMKKFNFNIYIAEENINILNESRRMIAIYDTPFQKVYEHSIASLGLYTSAGTTAICKCISQEYFDNMMDVFEKLPLNHDMKIYGEDILNFRKYNLYHEVSHLITIDLYPELIEHYKYIRIFEAERHLLFPGEDNYFASDIREYTAESLTRYLLDGRVGDSNAEIDFKETKTYKAMTDYLNKLSKTKL